jgi:hypothetical protein
MDTHSKGLTDANLQVLDLKRGFHGSFRKVPEWNFGGKRALSGQRCGATRSDGAGLPPRVFGKPLAAPEHKPALSPCACFSRGERAGGVGPSGFR